jgi:ABC-2 type transport system ATP-binding protein
MAGDVSTTLQSLPAADCVIATKALTRRFGRHRGVFDLNLTVNRGEVFGFLGPNGAGKSTTIRILLGLYRRSAGHAAVLGMDPSRDTVQIHRQVGYLPGELALFPHLTGRDILKRFARVRGDVDLRYRDELVDRFKVELDRPVRTLSKGNLQKIGVLLAFAHRPDLLILDEPSSGLDPLMQDEFARLVGETARDGRTVFLSSHDLDEVERLADRLAIIKDGRIIVTDTVEQLRSSAPKTVEFRFAHPIDPACFHGVDGVHVLSEDTTAVRLSVAGSIAPLLQIAVGLNPIDMTARKADLEELFLDYYRTDAQGKHRS